MNLELEENPDLKGINEALSALSNNVAALLTAAKELEERLNEIALPYRLVYALYRSSEEDLDATEAENRHLLEENAELKTENRTLKA